ncbi:TonB-dependent receptor [Telmatobacter bradus]|uniref:TonB-dependent receptor n=1 Tax=Telmatobacter bradus TaxID=474953 RepID=UPI003B432CB2
MCASACWAAPATVSGVVRNTADEPQMGAQVELLRADLSVAAIVITDRKGHFQIDSVLPGRYSVKAVCQSYLPSMREDVRVRTGTVVNLTLNTLYEAMQWLPAQPKSPDSPQDDWAWTLRSAANRPLLRWLEDGPLVMVDEGKGRQPHLKARLMATGQEGTFGESGERFSVTVEDTPAGSSELLARVDFAPETDAGMESMLGFRQDLGIVGSVQSIASIEVRPDVEGPLGSGLDEAGISGWESIHLGDLAEIEAGSTVVAGRLTGSGSTSALLPFVDVRVKDENSSLDYRLSSFVPHKFLGDSFSPTLPPLVVRNGHIQVEHGIHQQLGWERRTDASDLSVTVFTDHLHHPVIDSSSSSLPLTATSNSLLDPSSGMMRAVGADYSSTGIEAAVERRIMGQNRIRLAYADGNALVIPTETNTVPAGQLLTTTRPRRTQTYSLTLSGTLEGTGTRWRASYRWQPEDTVTPVAPFAVEASAPYLGLHLRQPIHLGSASFQTFVDVQNLLAQGYRSYVLGDGSLLLFAQDPRAVRGGLEFSF